MYVVNAVSNTMNLFWVHFCDKWVFLLFLLWFSVDLVRCSIAFDRWEDMEAAILKFVNRINTSQNRYIKKILRINNGFSTFRNVGYGKKLSLADYHYTDVRINVLISNQDGSLQIIGETRWILNMMQDVSLCFWCFFFWCFVGCFFNVSFFCLTGEKETAFIIFTYKNSRIYG